uniref:RNase H type-1 domain-containing protein n=1 Tax=Ditylenchus dipsaci TaxID=166011 RepID=A0A915CZJ6_9BILA
MNKIIFFAAILFCHVPLSHLRVTPKSDFYTNNFPALPTFAKEYNSPLEKKSNFNSEDFPALPALAAKFNPPVDLAPNGFANPKDLSSPQWKKYTPPVNSTIQQSIAPPTQIRASPQIRKEVYIAPRPKSPIPEETQFYKNGQPRGRSAVRQSDHSRATDRERGRSPGRRTDSSRVPQSPPRERSKTPEGLRQSSPLNNQYGRVVYFSDALATAENENILKVYTDASKKYKDVGIGVYFENPVKKYYFPLDKKKCRNGPLESCPFNTSGFGEVTAALNALYWLIETKLYKNKQIVLYTDYLPLIIALQNKTTSKRISQRCFFQHITGHDGYPGNLQADTLARQAIGLPPNKEIPQNKALDIPTYQKCGRWNRKLFVYIPSAVKSASEHLMLKDDRVVDATADQKIPTDFDALLKSDGTDALLF